MIVAEILHWQAGGGLRRYQHKKKENVQTTKLQDFLDSHQDILKEIFK
jgi:hypothetical protein